MANGRMLDKSAVYRIRVRGALASRWREWLEGFVIDEVAAGQAGDETTLVGLVADQSALYGVLLKLHTLGLLLLRVERVEPDAKRTGDSHNLRQDYVVGYCIGNRALRPERSFRKSFGQNNDGFGIRIYIRRPETFRSLFETLHRSNST